MAHLSTMLPLYVAAFLGQSQAFAEDSLQQRAGPLLNMCSKGQIIVIGAGTSGLAAADALLEHDCKVLVLEARDKIGGRSYSAPEGAAPFAGVDLGGHWIQGPAERQPVLQRLAELKVPVIRYRVGEDDFSGQTIDADGRVLDPKEVEHLETLYSKLEDAMEARHAELLERREFVDSFYDISVAEAFERALAAVESDLGRAFTALEMRFINNQRANAEQDMAGVYSDQGFKSFLGPTPNCINDGGISCDPKLPSAFVRGGYGEFVRQLAARHHIEIHYESPVSLISRLPSGAVEVTLVNGSKLEGAAALVTASLGVLKSGKIKFTPPLKDARQYAIDHLAIGAVDWLHLYFKEPFWPSDIYAFRYLSETPGDYFQFYSRLAEGTPYGSEGKGAPVLSTLLLSNSKSQFPGDGVLFEDWSDEKAKAYTMEKLRVIFSNANVPAEPDDFVVARWGKDPYVLGAYSAQPPGTDSKTNLALSGADFEGELRFAGEATCGLQWGTIHGAYISGLREACALLGPRCAESQWRPFAQGEHRLCEHSDVQDKAHVPHPGDPDDPINEGSLVNGWMVVAILEFIVIAFSAVWVGSYCWQKKRSVPVDRSQDVELSFEGVPES